MAHHVDVCRQAWPPMFDLWALRGRNDGRGRGGKEN